MPDTLADAGFACHTPGALDFWLVSDEPLTAGQPVEFRAGSARGWLTERFEADGVGLSNFRVLSPSPLYEALSTGAGKLTWTFPGAEPGRLRLGPEVKRLAVACR
jgi:hypothetical protein